MFCYSVEERKNLCVTSDIDWKIYCGIVKRCYVVRPAADFEETMFCSCPIGAKKLPCKHSVCIAVKVKHAVYPPSVASALIQTHRRPGRPRKAGGGQSLSRI